MSNTIVFVVRPIYSECKKDLKTNQEGKSRLFSDLLAWRVLSFFSKIIITSMCRKRHAIKYSVTHTQHARTVFIRVNM